MQKQLDDSSRLSRGIDVVSSQESRHGNDRSSATGGRNTQGTSSADGKYEGRFTPGQVGPLAIASSKLYGNDS